MITSRSPNRIEVLTPNTWRDYELLDSGNGQKLERYGSHILIRPAPQAIWERGLNEKEWQQVDGIFNPTREESGGYWELKKSHQPTSWTMEYQDLKFQATMAGSRHLGVFPEQASHWDWISKLITSSSRPLQVINLFGYTGLATLIAARAGAHVTQVDASNKSIATARHNQSLSKMQEYPIRWIVDDALKFIQREQRREKQYDGLILDPPKFGRGPKGEVWEFFDLMPQLLKTCREILSPKPLFVVLTAYAIQASAMSLYFSLDEIMQGYQGVTASGELALQDTSAGRILSMAIFARWCSGPPAG